MPNIYERKIEEVTLNLNMTYSEWSNTYLRFSKSEWYASEDNSWMYVPYIETLKLEDAYKCLKQS